ncbi:MAG: SDR family NAD(P)-dependent oxidoreductase [Chloroflexota bacterium]
METTYLADLFGLAGRVALITGAAGGLGEAIAEGLSRLGARVVVADLDGDAATNLAKRLAGEGRQALAVGVDVADRASVEAAMQAAIDRFGSLDILVNCAAIAIPSAALELSEENWQRLLEVNLKGTFLACQAAGQIMVRQHRGAIVNFASTAAMFGQAKSLGYSVSKAGVIELTRTLAVEWGPYGVRVNAVAPGVFATPMHKFVSERNPAFFERFLKGTPLCRFGRPEEMVGVVAFLASEASAMITGQLFPVDGGFTAGGFSGVPEV